MKSTLEPITGADWMRQVQSRLAAIERHRHPATSAQSDSSGLDSGWHYIGVTGEPPLGPGVVPYDSGALVWSSGRFRRDGAGCVHLDGLFLLPGEGAPPAILMFTLPVGFRPSKRQIFSTSPTNGRPPNQIEVLPNGSVNVLLAWGVPGYFAFLSGISFMADDALTVPWTPLTLTGGWHDYDTLPGINSPIPHGQPAYYIDSAGDVHFRGVVGGGAPSVAAFTLPPEAHDHTYKWMGTTACAGGFSATARWDFLPDGTAALEGYGGGGTHEWVSLAGIVISNPTGTWTGQISTANGWGNYGTDWPPAQYSVNKYGVGSLRGLVSNGSTAVPTDISNGEAMPPAFHPAYDQAILVGAGLNAAARLDIRRDGTLGFVGFINDADNGYLWVGGRWFTGTK
jgi:hypothetical protein